MRKVLFWSHLCVGCAAGIVIFVMCITGVLLAFEKQINSWADNHSRKPVHIASARLPLADLLERVRSAVPGNPSAITIYKDALQPVAVAFGRERTVFADPYSGDLLGEAARGPRNFFSKVERFHRALGGEVRGSLGRMFTGAGNLLFFGLLLSGLYLWLPKRLAWKNIGPAIWFRGGLKGRAKDWNWHNTTGIWSALPLLIITLTGIIMSYQWANNLLYTATGTTPPVPRTAPPAEAREGGRHPNRPSAGAPDQTQSLDNLFTLAEARDPNWKSVSLTLRSGGPFTFAIDAGNGGQPEKRSQLSLDARSGKPIHWEPFSSYNLGRRLRSYARFAHTGEEGGFVGQVVAAIASLAGALLVWTGLSLAANRLTSWMLRKRARGLLASQDARERAKFTSV